MNFYESIKSNLKESAINYNDPTLGYNIDTTMNVLSNYYRDKTGADIVDIKKAHKSGGGLSHTDYRRVQFSDGITMTFTTTSSNVRVVIRDPNEDTGYGFEVRKDNFADKINEFIEDGYIDNSQRSSFSYLNDTFDLSDAIENKGNEVLVLQNSGDNKEELIDRINKLNDDFPAIVVSGLWNGMSDGKLTDAKHIKDFLNKNTIYGGRDNLALYDNLVYLKTVSGSEMW